MIRHEEFSFVLPVEKKQLGSLDEASEERRDGTVRQVFGQLRPSLDAALGASRPERAVGLQAA